MEIGNLWVCDHEVTQKEYETYCKYGGDKDPSYSYGGNKGDGDDYPVYHVNWYDALVYCNLRSMAEGLNPVYKIKKDGGADGELTTNPAEWVDIMSDTTVNPVKYCGPSASNTQ